MIQLIKTYTKGNMTNKFLKSLSFLAIITNYLFSSDLDLKKNSPNFSENENTEIDSFVKKFNTYEKSVANKLYSGEVEIVETIRKIDKKQVEYYEKPLAPIILYYVLENNSEEELFTDNTARVRLNTVFNITTNSLYPKDDFYKKAFDTIFTTQDRKKSSPKRFKNRQFIAMYNTNKNYVIEGQGKFLNEIINFKFVNLLKDTNWQDLRVTP